MIPTDPKLAEIYRLGNNGDLGRYVTDELNGDWSRVLPLKWQRFAIKDLRINYWARIFRKFKIFCKNLLK